MYTIEVRHTCVIIHGYRWNDSWEFQKMFSIYDKLYHKYFPKGIYYDEENRDLYLPSGVDMGIIMKYFGMNVIRKIEADPYDTIPDVKLKYAPRDDDQKEAIAFCVSADKYKHTARSPQLSLNLSTGVGKTYVAIATSAFFGIRTMIILNTDGLLEQWRTKIKEYTNTEDSQIFNLVTTGSIGKLRQGLIPLQRIRYFLCSHSTLRSYANKYGWNELHELIKSLRCGIKIYDEAHLHFDNILMIDFFSDVCRTYYLTATPQRSDFFENRIYQLSFKNIPKINLYREELAHTHYVAVLFNSHPRPSTISYCRNQYGFDRLKYMEYFTMSKGYFNTLVAILEYVLPLSGDGKILMYIGINSAIMVTKNWLAYNYPSLSVGVYTTITPKEIKESQLECKLILSTTKSCGAAMDIANLKVTVVFNEPFKSEVLAKQTLGRTRAMDTYYFDMIDMGFESLRYYYTSKKKTFKKFAKSIKEISFTDELIRQVSIQKVQRDQAYQKQLETAQQNNDNIIEVMKFVDKD